VARIADRGWSSRGVREPAAGADEGVASRNRRLRL
jgi:hypothetical protein